VKLVEGAGKYYLDYCAFIVEGQFKRTIREFWFVVVGYVKLRLIRN